MINFKKASYQQINEISNFVNNAYRGEQSKVGWTTEADLLGGQRTDSEKIKNIISDPQSQILLAYQGNELAGCIQIRKDLTFLYFGMLTVKPDLQSQGIGKILIHQMEELALEWGFKKIKMTVLSQRHELIAFYERRGYQWTEETEPFPTHDPSYGIPKTDLYFKVFAKIL
jgi:ribosomal protein S18 acetylase RimI-like enzyme